MEMPCSGNNTISNPSGIEPIVLLKSMFIISLYFGGVTSLLSFIDKKEYHNGNHEIKCYD